MTGLSTRGPGRSVARARVGWEWLHDPVEEAAVGKEPLYRLPLIPPRAWLRD